MYAYNMTLAQRNLLFKAGVFLSACCILLLLALTGKLLPLLPEYSEAAARSSHLILRFFTVVPQIPCVLLFTAVLYALLVSIVVLVYFEKTQTTELLFVGLFAVSFVFEMWRLMVPLKDFYNISPFMLIFGTRMLIFSRLFGSLCLFISGVYAAGLEMQRQGGIIIGIIIAIMMISFKIPVNGFSWDTSYTMLYGYRIMLRSAEVILMIITGMSFLIAAYTRGIPDYRFIALGSVLVFFGRSLLFAADTWLTPLPAVIMLGAGTWIIVARLHQIYMWL
jgi:hypothetical protein